MRIINRYLKSRAGLAAVALVVVAIGSVGCAADDDGSSEEDEVRTAIAQQLDAEASGDVDAFLPHVTDNWLKTVVGADRAQVRENPSLFQSDERPEIGRVSVSGSKATAEVTFVVPDSRLSFANEAKLVREGGRWRTDELHVVSAKNVPSTSKRVNIELADEGVKVEEQALTSTQDLVFVVANSSELPRAISISKIPVGAKVEELFAFDGDGAPPGTEEVGSAFLFQPGDKADVVLRGRLAPGRYLILCFALDPEGEREPQLAEVMVR